MHIILIQNMCKSSSTSFKRMCRIMDDFNVGISHKCASEDSTLGLYLFTVVIDYVTKEIQGVKCHGI